MTGILHGDPASWPGAAPCVEIPGTNWSRGVGTDPFWQYSDPRPAQAPADPDRAPRLLFTIGLPRSGKTTEGRKWLHRQPSAVDRVVFGAGDDGYPRVLWDTDDLRMEMYGEQYRGCGEAMVGAVKHYAIAALLRGGHDCLVCGTHTTRGSLRKILEIRRDAIPVLIDTPEAECLRRAEDTGQGRLLDVIPRMARQLAELKAANIPGVIRNLRVELDAVPRCPRS